MISLKQYLSQPIGEAKDCEQCFVIVKPGFLDHCADIEGMFRSQGWQVDQTRITQLTCDQARELYEVHKDKDFYNDLCHYMSSGPSRAYIYKRFGRRTTQDTFDEVAKLKEEIRGKWGIDDCKNVLHSSDSFSAMEHEKVVYF